MVEVCDKIFIKGVYLFHFLSSLILPILGTNLGTVAYLKLMSKLTVLHSLVFDTTL